MLKTNIRDERVCSTETTAPRWLPNTPPLTAWPNGEWADSMGKRMDLKSWIVTVDPRPCSRVRCTLPIYIRLNKATERCSGSACCSTSLREADYDHHECQALICNNKHINYFIFPTSFRIPFPMSMAFTKSVDHWSLILYITWMGDHAPVTEVTECCLKTSERTIWPITVQHSVQADANWAGDHDCASSIAAILGPRPPPPPPLSII